MRWYAVLMALVVGLVITLAVHLKERAGALVRAGRDRGDVPGWVMVVVMTAALVVAILIPFREAIVAAIQNALSSVTGSSGQ